MQDHQSQSRLFALPKEIRDAIFDLVMANERVYVGQRRLPPPHCYGLIMSCRQAHEECIDRYYRCTTFAIDSESVSHGVAWLALLPDRYRDSISKLVFLRTTRYLDVYTMIRLRAVSHAVQQEILLEPLYFYFDKWDVRLQEGAVTAEFAEW